MRQCSFISIRTVVVCRSSQLIEIVNGIPWSIQLMANWMLVFVINSSMTANCFFVRWWSCNVYYQLRILFKKKATILKAKYSIWQLLLPGQSSFQSVKLPHTKMIAKQTNKIIKKFSYAFPDNLSLIQR